MKPETLQAMRWWAEGRGVEARSASSNSADDWVELSSTDELSAIGFSDTMEYRLKRRTIVIGDMEVPAPETEYLNYREDYFVPCLVRELKFDRMRWSGDIFDKNNLRLKLVHRTGESAAQHAKALIKISGGRL